jgi:hypothetical protein
MKTQVNISQTAKMSFLALAVFFMSAEIPAHAGEGKDSASNSTAFDFETQAAIDRLEALNNAVENAVKFTAPEVAEDIAAYELQAAEERLEDLNQSVEASLCYQPSMANEEAEAYDLAVAAERLENMNLAIEQSMKFVAPMAVEYELAEGKLEYVSVPNYTLPVSAIAVGLISAR